MNTASTNRAAMPAEILSLPELDTVSTPYAASSYQREKDSSGSYANHAESPYKAHIQARA
jgi:hypothetical protein